MYYVYIIKSLKDNNLYIGRTNNLERRITEHNRGAVRATKSSWIRFVLRESARKGIKERKSDESLVCNGGVA